MLKFSPKNSQSHSLIILCVIISIFGFIMPNLRLQFGLHSNIFSYPIIEIFSQIFLFQFFHGDILHLFLNSYFLYFVGPEVEARMSKNNFFYFFVFTTIIQAISLAFFTKNVITIGISGFCMALLAYVVMELWSLKHHRLYEFVALLSINISIGVIIDNISFVGHLVGAICGVIWWLVNKKFKKFL